MSGKEATVRFTILVSADKGLFPKRRTIGSAGADVCSKEEIRLPSKEVVMVGTGVHFLVMPDEYYAELHIRSSLAVRGIMLANSVGIIDSDYRDEVKMLLVNMNRYDMTIMKGERIGQLIIKEKARDCFFLSNDEEMDEQIGLPDRVGGFGSTGKF